MNYWRLSAGKSKIPEGSSHQDTWNFCEFYFLELYWILTVNTGEKFPHASGKGRGRGTILKLLSILFLTRSTLKRNYLTRASHAGALSDPNWLQLAVAFHIGERKSPTPAPSSHPAHLKRGECWEVPVKFTVQSHSLTKRLSPNLRTIKCFPLPCNSHITKGTAVPLQGWPQPEAIASEKLSSFTAYSSRCWGQKPDTGKIPGPGKSLLRERCSHPLMNRCRVE